MQCVVAPCGPWLKSPTWDLCSSTKVDFKNKSLAFGQLSLYSAGKKRQKHSNERRKRLAMLGLPVNLYMAG